MERPEQAMLHAGLIFTFTIWLQGQMTDLILLRGNPELVTDFVANPEKIPAPYHKLRVEYWRRDFGKVKEEFLEVFGDLLTEQERQDIEQIYVVRNMIGHAHISMGRDYMLYRPKDERKEKKVLRVFDPKEVQDKADPITIKLSFWKPEVFQSFSDQIGRLDQVCFARLAKEIGVPHGRIR